MSRCLSGPPRSAALYSGYAQTEYTEPEASGGEPGSSPRFWVINAASCPRTAGPFKTGLGLIGHTCVAASRLLASQLITETRSRPSRSPRRPLVQSAGSCSDRVLFLLPPPSEGETTERTYGREILREERRKHLKGSIGVKK